MKSFEHFKPRRLPSPYIKSLIKEGDIEALTEALNALSPFEIAELIANKSEEEQPILFRALSPPLALLTFDFLSIQTQRRLLHAIPILQAASLLKGLSPDDRTNFLQELLCNIFVLGGFLPNHSERESVKQLLDIESILSFSVIPE